jgi:cytosine/adenosine deaminase-related metal-dependent hydrolase
MRTAISASHVIGFRGGDHVVFEDGEVVYEDHHIIFVGHDYGEPVDTRIQAGRAIVSPGLIDLNALADVDHAILDSWQSPEQERCLFWSQDYAGRGAIETLSRSQRAFRRTFALCQLIRNGITTAMPIASETHGAWAETYEDLSDLASAATDLGLRMYLGPSFRAGVTTVAPDGSYTVHWDHEAGQRGLDVARRFAAEIDAAGSDLLRGCLLPCRIESMSEELLRQTRALQLEGDYLVRLHCLQSGQELQFLQDWYGQSPIEVLAETELLTNRLLIPHAAFIGGLEPTAESRAADLKRISSAGATVVHCPWTLARYAAGLDSFDSYLAAGVKMAMGTDSYPPDLIRGMDYASNIAKVVTGDLAAGNAADLFRAATIGGADALDRPDLGRLAPGARADITIFGLDGPHIGAIDDPIRTLLMQGSGRDAQTVIIDGRIVMRDREIPGIDLDAMHAEVQHVFATLRDGYGHRNSRGRSADELFPSSFPTVSRAGA